jgi:MSHA biogenesis protein MshP
MCRNMNQRGFSLIMAVFLIVVLGGIAVFIGRVSTMQHQSSALDEEGAMAYQAAKSGIEWGVYQAVAIGSTGCANSTFTLAVPTPTSTVNYTVKVECDPTPATEGSIPDNVNVYEITATAKNAAAVNAAGGNFAVERQLTATVSQ